MLFRSLETLTLAVLAVNPGRSMTPAQTDRPSARPSATPEATTASPPSTAPTAGPTRTPAPAQSFRTYRVQSGDTLSGIAGDFDTTPSAIAQLNGISVGSTLSIGQLLKIPN